MIPLVTLESMAASLPDADIDTDIIYPARFLLITEREGLGRYAFHDRRSAADFPVCELSATDVEILVCGSNFGCGSSREQAVWALAGLGLRLLIAPSFGEIFRANCGKNGVLAITQPDEMVDRLHAAARAGERFSLDLVRCTLDVASIGTVSFPVAEDVRQSLLNGWDETARIRALHSDDIDRFEAAQRKTAPWLWTRADAPQPTDIQTGVSHARRPLA